MNVLVIATLDTKGEEAAFVRDSIRAKGQGALLLDAGVFPPETRADLAADLAADIPAEEVAAAGGGSLAKLRAENDRGRALAVMERGVAAIARRRYDAGEVSAVLGLGGSGGTVVATAAMRALPVGLPKLMVSTVASGDVGPYVGVSDLAMLYSVVDLAGLNRVSRRVLENAVGMVCGALSQTPDEADERPVLAATMFGVTTPAVTKLRARLERAAYEVLVFHATGSGGRAMEGLVRDGFVAGVADLTTTELADELVGGVLFAGPTRLTAAGERGVPQVVSVGALDMVNFWARDTVPERFRGRTLYEHNANVTLLRTTKEENRALGRVLAEKLNAAVGPVTLMLPLQGLSALDAPGQPFHDPEADAALFGALRSALAPRIKLVEVDAHINDDAFADACARELLALLEAEDALHPTR